MLFHSFLQSYYSHVTPEALDFFAENVPVTHVTPYF